MAGSDVPLSGHTESELETSVSDAVSRLYLNTFGKGPLYTVTFITPEVITTVMHDVFTVAEQTLITNGRLDSVLTTRMLWQHATEQTFKDAVEGVTGRRVLTVVSGFELDDNVATEVFVLAPT